MREFSRSLPMSLLRAREAVMRQFRPSLRDHGLTEQQSRSRNLPASLFCSAPAFPGFCAIWKRVI
jgi:hypothetical protein